MKIFMATYREEEEGEANVGMEVQGSKEEAEDEEDDVELRNVNIEKWKGKENDDDDVREKPHMSESERGDDEEEENKHEADEEEEMEEIMVLKHNDYKEDEKDKPESNDSCCSASNEEATAQAHIEQTSVQQYTAPVWVPSIITRLGKDTYHYAGQDIVIYESMDSFGAVMWPAALALCSFLDNNRQRVNLQGKEVLELGAGTGLVTIVASLLGASVTATDLPEVLGNLQANVMRNTRGRCRHTPQLAALSWGYDLEHTYPSSLYHYNYVLAADSG
ncbi:protein-lysine methyltransferase METTL21E-like [Morone saxatilis]|uniref:protein-lysine methyltransferase METTL21E-like n=1 Tax=Morone saxatilis TaxID=34816 RepID=UPI0015E20915|nr:protein-lysine methyltransferase METTL21E-like [Morone saxatilis]